MPKQNKNKPLSDWEKEFDNEFVNKDGAILDVWSVNKIKQFIKSLLNKQRVRDREEMVEEDKVKQPLEKLCVDSLTASIMKTMNNQEARIKKLEKLIKGNWSCGYRIGAEAEMNHIITLAEDRLNEMTFTDFIWYLKERRKKLLSTLKSYRLKKK